MEIDTFEKAAILMTGLGALGGLSIILFGGRIVRWFLDGRRPKKVCPRCGARVQLHAIKCPYCEWYWRKPRSARA
jgi:ribosomal protein L40E